MSEPRCECGHEETSHWLKRLKLGGTLVAQGCKICGTYRCASFRPVADPGAGEDKGLFIDECTRIICPSCGESTMRRPCQCGWGGEDVKQDGVKYGCLDIPLERRREPTPKDFTDPRFDIVWNVIKRVDVDFMNGLFSGATGDDVCAILDELDTVASIPVSDTREAQIARIARGAVSRTKPEGQIEFEISELASTIEREVRAEQAGELNRLKDALCRQQDDVCQTLGKVLGYPWFKNDQVNFPGADETNGVCVGDHVAESIAMEAARRIKQAQSTHLAQLTALRAQVEQLDEAPYAGYVGLGDVLALLDALIPKETQG